MTNLSGRARVGVSWLLAMTALGALAACGDDDTADPGSTGGRAGSSSGGKGGTSAGGAGGAAGAAGNGAGGGIQVGGTGAGGATAGAAGSTTGQSLDVKPAAGDPSLTVTINQDASKAAVQPTIAFQALFNGSPVSAGWTVDRGEIGSVAPLNGASTTFTARGTGAGSATVTASVTTGSQTYTVKRTVNVKIATTQSGANEADTKHDVDTGGGVGGVGGEGVGAALDPGKAGDKANLDALGAPQDGATKHLALLYPYDGTVFPRGLSAPLLQWSSDLGDADAVKIELSTKDGSYTYTGTFGRPAKLGASPFVRHPIPADAWAAATSSASGPGSLTMRLTVAKGGVAYGPVTQTFSIAGARLTGTVYYNSYGTSIVQNWSEKDAAGHRIGAAILGIRSGDTGPHLVVGQNSEDNSGCRVCHVVASRGKWLITQSEQGAPGDGRSYLYDLTAADVPGSSTTLTQEGVFAWAAMTSDGSYALTNSIDPSSTNPAITGAASGKATSSFWQFGPSPVASTIAGLPPGVAAGYPTYSADDKMVAYVDATGSTNDVKGPIAVAGYDPATQLFSNVRTVATPGAGPGHRVGYPVFLPDNGGLLFESEVRAGSTDSVMVTRNGARSELWWVNLTGDAKPVALANLNGKKGDGSIYLPKGPNNHGASTGPDPQNSQDESAFDDTSLNYEPAVLPVVAGGYAWVVFTSRRMYGNQLTATPWQSWPPTYDTRSLAQATVKKLWVAAIDLNAPAGTDPSHPAFYLPAQELLAGNSRGFWVLDPCRGDGNSCETGDQCCGGFCQPSSADPGQLVCGQKTNTGQCSNVQEKCTTAADCCASTNRCLNGFCAQDTPIQ